MKYFILMLAMSISSFAIASENMRYKFTKNSMSLFEKSRPTGVVVSDIFSKFNVQIVYKFEEAVLNENVICYKAIKSTTEDQIQASLLNFPKQPASYCVAKVDLSPR